MLYNDIHEYTDDNYMTFGLEDPIFTVTNKDSNKITFRGTLT